MQNLNPRWALREAKAEDLIVLILNKNHHTYNSLIMTGFSKTF